MIRKVWTKSRTKSNILIEERETVRNLLVTAASREKLLVGRKEIQQRDEGRQSYDGGTLRALLPCLQKFFGIDERARAEESSETVCLCRDVEASVSSSGLCHQILKVSSEWHIVFSRQHNETILLVSRLRLDDASASTAGHFGKQFQIRNFRQYMYAF
jgi:hypothetical protein